MQRRDFTVPTSIRHILGSRRHASYLLRQWPTCSLSVDIQIELPSGEALQNYFSFNRLDGDFDWLFVTAGRHVVKIPQRQINFPASSVFSEPKRAIVFTFGNCNGFCVDNNSNQFAFHKSKQEIWIQAETFADFRSGQNVETAPFGNGKIQIHPNDRHWRRSFF